MWWKLEEARETISSARDRSIFLEKVVGIARRVVLVYCVIECDGVDVKVFCLFFFDVCGWEGWGVKSFLCFVVRSAARDGEYEGGLVCRRRVVRDVEIIVLVLVNVFIWVYKV